MIIITTSQSIIKLNKLDLSWEIIHSGDGLYYGIEFYNDHLYVASRKRLVSSKSPMSEEDGEIKVFDKNLNIIEVIKAPFKLRDMHQIRFIDDDLYITCTYDNMIAIRKKNGEWIKWYPLGEPNEEKTDINHFNSIILNNDEIVINCHNHDKPSEILYFDKSFKLIRTLKIGKQIHNYWIEDNEIFTNSSIESKIISTGGFTKYVGQYPRGYCLIDDKKYIGVSKLSERSYRDFTTGVINIYDNNWNFIKNICLEKQGLISDIYHIR